MQVFSDVAKAVSRNLSAASVAIEDPHTAIRNRAFFQKYKSESTDSVMPVTQGDAQGFGTGDLVVKVFHKDIIVSGGFHFGKSQQRAFGAHMVNVHQFRVVASVACRYDVRHCVGGVKRSEAGNACLHCVAVQLYIKIHGGIICCAGINNISDLSVVQQPENAVVFGNGRNDGNINAERLNHHCGVRRGKQTHSEHLQLFRKGKRFRAVVFLYTEQNADFFPGRRHGRGKPSRRQSFEQRFVQRSPDSENLSGGFHFWPQIGIGIGQFFKREYRHFDCIIRRGFAKPCSEAEILDCGSGHNPCGKIHHRDAGDFADVGNCSGGAGIHFDYVKFVLPDQVLDIDQALCAERKRQLFGAFDNSAHHGIADVVGRVYGNRIPAVYTRALDVLHDAGNEHILAVGDHVHFQLGTHHVFVHQHRVLNAARQNPPHIAPQMLLVVHDGHVLPADDVRGAQQHRITEAFRCLGSFRFGQHTAPLGALDAVCFQEGVEPFPILRDIDSFRRSAENPDAVAIQKTGQADGGLTAESNHYADGLFHLDDIHHILRAKRLEVQPICRVVVRGDGFRVVIDNHHIKAELFQRPDAVHRGVIEFDSLTDPDRA